MDFYREQILEHYRSPHNFGSLKNPTVSFDGENISCGDKINMQAVITNNKVVEVAFNGESCAIGTASASMLTDFAIGKSKQELMKLQTEDITKLIGAELTPTRLQCALLPLEVWKKRLSKGC